MMNTKEILHYPVEVLHGQGANFAPRNVGTCCSHAGTMARS